MSGRTALCACTATPVIRIGWFLILVRVGLSVLRAAAAGWPTLQLISWIASFPKFRSGNGCCRFLFRYDIALPTMLACSGMFCRFLSAPCSLRSAGAQAFPHRTVRRVAALLLSCSASGMP